MNNIGYNVNNFIIYIYIKFYIIIYNIILLFIINCLLIVCVELFGVYYLFIRVKFFLKFYCERDIRFLKNICIYNL